MRNKWRNKLAILNHITNTEKYKVIFVFTIILALYGSIILGVNAKGWFESVLVAFQFPIFNMFMFALLFLNTLNTSQIFNSEFSFYIIRLENRRKYLKELLIINLISNLFHLIVFFLLFSAFMCFIHFGEFNVYTYQNYDISNFVYLIFYLKRYLAIAIIICSISTLLTTVLKSRLILLTNGIFLIGFIAKIGISEFQERFALLPWLYFTNLKYDYLSIELAYSALFIFTLGVLLFVLYKLVLRNKKWVIS